MKLPIKFFVGAALLVILQFGLSSCVSEGYVGVDTGVYYGPHYRDPWFHEGPWLNGRRWYREPHRGYYGPYLHPPRRPRPPRW